MPENILLPLALLCLFGVLAVMEARVPLRSSEGGIVWRFAANIGIAVLSFCVAAVTVRPAISVGLGIGRNDIGLLPFFGADGIASIALGCMLMDFAFYLWHRANHGIGFLWRFHNVHHVDPHLDVSTAVRFHFGEIALSSAFQIAQLSIIGVDALTFAIYQCIFHASVLFHHSNLKLPIVLERSLSWLIVTPRMHGIHHSQVARETNSNFCVVLSIWDRLCGTARLNVPQNRLSIGVPGYSLSGDAGFLRSLRLPFERQRDYWSRPDGTRPERDESELTRGRQRLAE